MSIKHTSGASISFVDGRITINQSEIILGLSKHIQLLFDFIFYPFIIVIKKSNILAIAIREACISSCTSAHIFFMLNIFNPGIRYIFAVIFYFISIFIFIWAIIHDNQFQVLMGLIQHTINSCFNLRHTTFICCNNNTYQFFFHSILQMYYFV